MAIGKPDKREWIEGIAIEFNANKVKEVVQIVFPVKVVRPLSLFLVIFSLFPCSTIKLLDIWFQNEKSRREIWKIFKQEDVEFEPESL